VRVCVVVNSCGVNNEFHILITYLVIKEVFQW